MSYDLIFGKTARDWSCGAHVESSAPIEITTRLQVNRLAEDTNREIVRSTNLAIRLGQNKRLPDAEKEPFKRFHKKWLAFMGSKKGRYRPEDTLALWNYRKLNERFKARFDVFAKVAATPLRKPPTPAKTTALAAFPKQVSLWTWAVPLWAGLTIAGLTWLGGISRRPT